MTGSPSCHRASSLELVGSRTFTQKIQDAFLLMLVGVVPIVEKKWMCSEGMEH